MSSNNEMPFGKTVLSGSRNRSDLLPNHCKIDNNEAKNLLTLLSHFSVRKIMIVVLSYPHTGVIFLFVFIQNAINQHQNDSFTSA